MRFFKIFAMLMGFICLAASSRALAAEADMQAFRDVYLQNMSEAKGYHLELMFNGPTLQSNVIADGQLWNNGAAVAEGRMSWDYTDLAAGQTKRTEMPFYAERSGNVVVLYGNRGGQWQRENILEGFTWILNAVCSDDRETKMKYAATVKDVKLEDVGKGQQRMQVTFDGKELSAVEDKAVRESIAAMSEADSRDAMATVVYLNAALAASDLKITWTVDKKTGETDMVAADLTDVMRNYAKAMLQDSYDGKISLAQEEVDMLASIGYYYNLQLYLVRNKESAKQAVIPASVKNRAQEGNLFGDINSEVVSALKK